MKCSECPFRIKRKEPVGGLRKYGTRWCGKTGAQLKKEPIINMYGFKLMEYPKGCTGNGYQV